MKNVRGIAVGLFIFIVTVAALAFANPARAEKRVALVIGNSSYLHVPRLANPANDAGLMADALRAVGFTLIGGGPQLDLDEVGLRRATQMFGEALQGADVGLFYYAGHALEMRGANYLVPVGANPVKEADADFQMMDARLVMRQMESAGTKLNIVVLDACRNNPFAGRGLRATGSGLAQMQAPEGTLISFATQPGNVALDGAGQNSPYTAALAAAIGKPGLDIFRTFNQVGLAVANATAGQQQPWVSSSPIKGEFYFAGRAPAANVNGGTPAAGSSDSAARAWDAVKDTKDKVLLDAFLQQFPDGFYAALARSRIKQLSETKVAVGIATDKPPPSAPTREYKPGETFRDCERCPEMVVVPGGSYNMGSRPGEKGRGTDESPRNAVHFTWPFAVGKFEVTFAEWDACAADGGCNGYRPKDQGWERDRMPVINVSWEDAQAYIGWLRRKTGRKYQLLSESQWEYVARAGTQTRFACGDGVGCLNGAGWHYQNSKSGTHPVGKKSPNAYGLYDTHGNVWEWTQDCYKADYYGIPTDGKARMERGCEEHVLRGGAWRFDPMEARSANREKSFATNRNYFIGFRVGLILERP